MNSVPNREWKGKSWQKNICADKVLGLNANHAASSAQLCTPGALESPPAPVPLQNVPEGNKMNQLENSIAPWPQENPLVIASAFLGALWTYQ